MVMPGAASLPTVSATPVPEFHMKSGPEPASESFVEEVPPRPEPLQIDSSSQPVAFGSLLKTPAEDWSFTTAGPQFTMETDWRDRDSEEVAEEEEEQPSAGRRDGPGAQGGGQAEN